MAPVELRPCDRPPPGWKPPQDPPKPPFDFKQFRSSLASMTEKGTHYGFRAFHFLSRMLLALKAAFKTETKNPVSPGKQEVKSPNRTSKKLHLKKPEEFLRAFSKSPAKVMGKLFDLLLKRPETAREVLLNLARFWKEHPGHFLKYEKTDAMRNQMRATLNDFFKDFVLTESQKRFQQKILEGDFTPQEAQIMSSEPVTDMTPELEQFQRDYQAMKRPESLGQPLWDSILAFLEGKNALEDLIFQDGEERSFDRVVEAMLCHRSFTSLRSRKAYASNQKLFLSLLDYLLADDILGKYPAVEPLVRQAHALLSDEMRASSLKDLVREVLDIVDPISKSPPRRT